MPTIGFKYASAVKMDAESQQLSLQSPSPADRSDQGGISFHLFSQSEAQCLVCRRAFSFDAELNDGFEAICICRECKNMVLDDNQTNISIQDIRGRRRRRHRSRSRFVSSEPVQDSFSQQFSRLINLANQNREVQTESNTTVTTRRRGSYYAAHSRSQRRQRASSDNETDGFDHLDSLFGDTDSNLSFGGYGGDSDTSVDRHSLLDREIFFQLENESYDYTDTDIDPMHAGLDQWNSDDEDGDWEQAYFDGTSVFLETPLHFQDSNISPSGTSRGRAEDGSWVWRINGSQEVHYADIFTDLEELHTRPVYVGNPGDYVDARGFDELLEQLAEIDSSRRGAPPASASCVSSLPCVNISKDHEKNGMLICAICKDLLLIGTEAKQLPCMHLYHPCCILPWLSARNSCPVCRYELPTDDPEYEATKMNTGRAERHESQQLELAEETYDTGTEDDETDDVNYARVEQGSSEVLDQTANRSHRGAARGGWLFLAAAPIVSIVGIVLVLCLRKPVGDQRIQGNSREQQLPRSQTLTSRSGGNRRWWSIF